MAISPRRRLTQALITSLLVPFLAWAGAWAVRAWRASADAGQAQALTSISTARALGYVEAGLRWRPDEADLWRQRADLASFAVPRVARAYARRAVELNPRAWRAWQTLGLLDFQLGDSAASRRDLVQASRYDHGFASHFALGNLALAQGNESEFLKEMTAALAISPLDRVYYALHQIVSHSDPSPAELAATLPASRADVIARGIEIFLTSGKFAAAIASWRRLHCQSYQYPDCREAALALTNGLAAAAFASEFASPRFKPPSRPDAELPSAPHMIASAMGAWNQAVHAGILSQAPVAAGSVSDGYFQHSWVGPAFSWQSARVLPLTVTAFAQHGNAVRFPFNGYQPDDAPLLKEFVPVAPGATYSISYQTRRQIAGSETGLELRILATPERQLAAIPAALYANWSLNSATILVPKSVHLIQLVFAYARPNGQVRLHDPVLVAGVQMQQLFR